MPTRHMVNMYTKVTKLSSSKRTVRVSVKVATNQRDIYYQSFFRHLPATS